MTFLSHFRIAFLLLWIKGKEPTFERISVKRSEERLACLYAHSAACVAVAVTAILGGIMGKLALLLSRGIFIGFDFLIKALIFGILYTLWNLGV